MQDLLKVTLIQSDVHWESIDANLASFEEKIWQIDGSTDLIVLPEMFTTGFTMLASKISEAISGKTFRWMKQMAGQTGACIIGSFVLHENKQYFNRLIAMLPDGKFFSYNKRHLFRMAGEDENFTAGNKSLIFNWKGWNIMPLICYDLRFPVWGRNRVDESGILKYDIQLFIANWPDSRLNAWNTLLRARAIENSSYVAGVNRIGLDGNGIHYSGNTNAYDFKGNPMLENSTDSFISTIIFSKSELSTYREKFPVQFDGDNFEIIV